MTRSAAAGCQQQGRSDEIEFCSYCGRFGDDGPFRVCSACGLGVRLRASARALESSSVPFLIVRADGIISAVSAAAEREIPHAGPLLGRPLLAVLASDDDLAEIVSLAARGLTDVTAASVRANGLHLRATVAPCGDPPAALVAITRKPAATARS